MHTNSSKRPILAVHGVGTPLPVELINEVISGLPAPLNQLSRWTWQKVVVGNQLHDVASNPDPADPLHVYEMNWSDLKQRPSGIIGVFVYAFNILLALVQVASTGWRDDRQGAGGPLYAGPLYRFFFSVFLVPFPFMAAMVIAAYCIRSNSLIAIAVIGCLTIISALFVRAIWRKEPLTLGALPLLAVACGFTGVCAWNKAYSTLQPAYQVAEGLAVGAGLLIFVCIAEALVRFVRFRATSGETITAFFARSATFILPNALYLGGGGALITGLILSSSAITGIDAGAYTDLHGGSRYELFYLEAINGGLTALLGLYLLAVGLVWGLLAQFPITEPLRIGLLFRKALILFLAMLIPALLILMAAYFDLAVAKILGRPGVVQPFLREFTDPFAPLFGVADPQRADPAAVYIASATRLIPWLLLFVGPLRLATELAADVLFYVLPSRFALAIRDRSRDRFTALHDWISSRHGVAPVVAAHSQGTVIAADNLKNTPNNCLVTFGSPLEALYCAFLARPVPAVAGRWVNIFRLSDPIGGKISVCPTNTVLSSNYHNNHVFYFREPLVAQEILKLR